MNTDARGPVKVLTPAWWSLVEHAIREGARTGVRVGTFNCPGWSQSGGPWVKPSQSMRYVTISEIRVKGPQKFSGRLATTAEHFQDIAVLAFPAPKGDADALTVKQAKVPAGDSQIDLTGAEQPFTARSLTLTPAAPNAFRAEVELQAAGADGQFRSIRTFTFDRSNPNNNVGPMPWGPVTVAFPAVQATRFRLLLKGVKKPGEFASVELSSAARLERYVEKQLGKMWQTPSPLWDAYLWPAQTWKDPAGYTVPRAKVLNLSARMAADGTFTWNVPAGEWIVLRTGMAPTGVTNAPASPEGTGLEIDKMNRGLVRYHFQQFMGKMLERLTPAERQAMGHVIADSYETGAQNWTDGMAAAFQKRYGYDPLPWLPVLTGRVVDSADASDRFLWDLRRMVADRISYDYVGGLRDVAAEHGLRLWLENYGHWGYPGEFLQYGGQATDLGGEFWAGRGLGAIELRAASSAGHIYGKPVISAEAFTGGPAWQSTPWALRQRGDWATAQGINHFVLHVYIHQPDDTKIPGISAWFGTEFNRLNTWFPQSREWVEYLRRTHFLLQQGKGVADVAYFIGEDAPKMTGQTKPELPEGYSFDYINGEVIEKRLTVKDGRFVLPDGMSYRLLVLPEQTTMRPAVLRKLKDLAAAGGAILGPKPNRSPSMEAYPAADREVQRLAAAVWANSKNVYSTGTLTDVLARQNVQPDLTGLDREHFPWAHRSGPEGDIYFLSHQGDEPVTRQVSFRVTGRQPELWDAVTGEHRDLPEFREEQGRTVVPLQFAPRQSLFVLFRKPAAKSGGANFPALNRVAALTGPWSVAFDPKWGPTEPVAFDALADWTTRPEPAIRHFSGTAVYRKQFTLTEAGGRLYLDLGKLENSLARVKVNGKDVGLVWCAPWRIEISGAAHAGTNDLEIAVTNTWNNRLVGDLPLPASERKTWASIPRVTAKTPLQPAGLLGPVTVQSAPR